MRQNIRWLACVMLWVSMPAWSATSQLEGQGVSVQPVPGALVMQLLGRAHTAFSSNQAVLVQAVAETDSHAVLTRYEKSGDTWRKVGVPVPAVLGEHGIALRKVEGDKKSPAGIFPFGRSFGSVAAPSGIRMPYTRTTPYDYWVDAPESSDYNRWVTTFEDPYRYWRSFEKLDIPAYRHAVVVKYNSEPVIAGRGSAIFLHVWPGPDGHTVGCTAMDERELVALIKWLDPAQHPVIIQGTPGQLSQLATAGK